MKISKVLDLTNEKCPRVVLMIRKEADTMGHHDIMKVISGDSGSVKEIRCYVKYMKMKILESTVSRNKSEYIYIIQKE